VGVTEFGLEGAEVEAKYLSVKLDRTRKVGHKNIDIAESHCWILVSERFERAHCWNLGLLTRNAGIANRLTKFLSKRFSLKIMVFKFGIEVITRFSVTCMG
jgi:hypothetical protein